MDKTLDVITVVHRVIMALAMTMLVVGASIHQVDPVYDGAKSELQSLQEAIKDVDGTVGKAYEQIYVNSQIKVSISQWLREHRVKNPKFDLSVVALGDLEIPNYDIDPYVTVDDELRWVDRMYREPTNPLLLCVVERGQVFKKLDSIFALVDQPNITRVNIYLHESHPDGWQSARFRCSFEMFYTKHIDKLTGMLRVNLDIPSFAADVASEKALESVSNPQEISEMLKGHGLGDPEDSDPSEVSADDLHSIWTDIAHRNVSDALAFIEQKKLGEEERAKRKIDLLGDSLDAGSTILIASLVQLSLMAYLLVLLMQVSVSMSGHVIVVAESTFFGAMKTAFGRIIICISLVIPIIVSGILLFGTLPSLETEWLSQQWIQIFALCTVAAMIIVDLTLFANCRSILRKI